jgi:dihydrofolate synthase/folylpolyglutamate synthase
MNYKEALNYIHSTYKFGSKLGLENIKGLLRLLGNPHECFPVIHVGGTNGKGSVTSMLTHVLQEAGYRVGMFISPYLERFTERVQVNLEEIPPEDLGRITGRVKEKVDEMLKEGKNHPTEFEIITAIGFVYFAERQVDYAVVEVGLGGRLDSTNVVDPLISTITSISYDHMGILGNTLAEIAYEKAGIIKPNRPVVTYPQHKQAMDVIRRVASERNSPLFVVNEEGIVVHYSHIGRQVFDYTFNRFQYPNMTIRLTGRHQVLNAATALTALTVLKSQGVPMTETSIYRGMERATWPGRIEVLQKNPYIILDGAHNASGASALRYALEEYFVEKPITMVIGILKDKEVKTILEELCPLANSVIVTKPDSHRAMEPYELAEMVDGYCPNVVIENCVDRAVKLGLSQADKDGVLLFTGSLYLVGRVRHFLSYLPR